jgi:hypothetical protein
VTAVSANDAWAVGCTAFCFLHSVTPQMVILHWNGTAWTQASSPAPGQFSQLVGVAATSASDAWAVGSDLGGTIVQHWNGTIWK